MVETSEKTPFDAGSVKVLSDRLTSGLLGKVTEWVNNSKRPRAGKLGFYSCNQF